MADIQKTIQVIFNGEDKLSGDIRSIRGALNDVQSGVGGVTQPLATLTSGLLKTETALLGLAAAYGGFAITQALKFQSAQTDLAKVLGDGDPAIESFTEGVYELSEAYGVSSADVLQGIANFKQAGFTAKEAALLQKDALDLVIAGDVDAANATEILVASLKGFGAEASEASRFTEALNNVSNEYATDLEQLAIGMSKVSPIAEKMGFSFEEATGLLTPVIEIFRSGPEAANALRTGLLKLIDDAAPVGEALEKIGVSQLNANGQMRSGKDIFLDVAEAFKTLDQNQKLVITSQIVGTEQAAKMVSVFDNLAKVQSVTATAMARTGSVSDEVNLRLAGGTKGADKMVASFNNLASAIGTKLLPSFTDATGGIGSILQALRGIATTGGFNQLFDALAKDGESIKTLLDGIAKALPAAFEQLDFDNIINAFNNLKGSIGDLFGDLDLTDPDDLSEVLQKLVDFMGLLTNATAGVVDSFAPMIGVITSFLENLSNGDADMQSFIGNVLGMGAVLNTLLPILGGIALALGGVNTALNVKNLVSSTASFGSISSVLSKIGPVGLAAGAALSAVTFAISENVDKYQELEGIVAQTTKVQEQSTDKQKQIAERLKEISEASGVTVTSMDELNKSISDGTIIFDVATRSYTNAIQPVKDFDAEVADAATNSDFLAEGMKGVAEAFANFGQTLNASTGSVSTAADEQAKLTALISEAQQKGQSYQAGIKDGVAVIKTWGGAQKEAGKEVAKTGDEVEELTKREALAIENTSKLENTLLELASNERIAAMEFTASINVAQIEADAKRVEAAFVSAASVVGSTQETLSSLFATGAAEGDVFGFDFERQLRQANERADIALDNATKLNDAQIDYMRSRAESLRRGDAKIKIIADNLNAPLQYLLKTLLEHIQIQANEEGLELLL